MECVGVIGYTITIWHRLLTIQLSWIIITQSHNHHQTQSNRFPEHVPCWGRIPRTQDDKKRIDQVFELKRLFDFVFSQLQFLYLLFLNLQIFLWLCLMSQMFRFYQYLKSIDIQFSYFHRFCYFIYINSLKLSSNLSLYYLQNSEQL